LELLLLLDSTFDPSPDLDHLSWNNKEGAIASQLFIFRSIFRGLRSREAGGREMIKEKNKQEKVKRLTSRNNGGARGHQGRSRPATRGRA
jgi:hypothetical protein